MPMLALISPETGESREHAQGVRPLMTQDHGTEPVAVVIHVQRGHGHDADHHDLPDHEGDDGHGHARAAHDAPHRLGQAGAGLDAGGHVHQLVGIGPQQQQEHELPRGPASRPRPGTAAASSATPRWPEVEAASGARLGPRRLPRSGPDDQADGLRTPLRPGHIGGGVAGQLRRGTAEAEQGGARRAGLRASRWPTAQAAIDSHRPSPAADPGRGPAGACGAPSARPAPTCPGRPDHDGGGGGTGQRGVAEELACREAATVKAATLATEASAAAPTSSQVARRRARSSASSGGSPCWGAHAPRVGHCSGTRGRFTLEELAGRRTGPSTRRPRR